MSALTLVFILDFSFSVYAVFLLLRDSNKMRQNGLGAAFGIFWWTILCGLWGTFALAVYLHK